MNSTQEKIHGEALQRAVRFRESEAALLEIIQRVEETHVFSALGYGSLFQYCVLELRLSEAVTANFISVGRKAREVPELQRVLASGDLSVSKARKILPVLDGGDADPEWVKMACTKTSRELERAVDAA